MNEQIVITLTLLGLLGSLAQWFAWWVKLPAILFLLLIGILVGPVLGVFDPDTVFGDLLFPIVSLSVAVILFEGALTLKFRELKGIESVVRNMVTGGVLITWMVITLATHWIMGFNWSLSFLFGALVVVTGPTVIVPMLRTVRPKARVANILRWEGIVIDPIGALLAVLVFDFIISSHHGAEGLGHVFLEFGKTVLIGAAFGVAAGHALGILLRRHWIPEFLHNIVTLSVVLAIYTASNHLREESGLLAVTIMGIWMANMRKVPMEDILNFKESLSILLISSLFIILAARIDLQELAAVGWSALAVFLVIQFIARPIKILASTWGSDLSWQEKAMLGWIAPRGIVAAAVSALFALRLEDAGFEQAPLMVSLTFAIIIGTVVLQSATARPMAVKLGVAEPEPRGLLIIGANKVARQIALALKEQGFRTLLTDSHWPNVSEALLVGLDAFWGNAISERADRHLDLVGIGKMLGLSQNDHLNVLAAQRYAREFGKGAVYVLPPPPAKSGEGVHTASQENRGELLFGEDIPYAKLASLISKGAEIKATRLTESFTWEQYKEQYGNRAIPLFAVSPKGSLRIFGDSHHPIKPGAGWTILALIKPEGLKDNSGAASNGTQ